MTTRTCQCFDLLGISLLGVLTACGAGDHPPSPGELAPVAIDTLLAASDAVLGQAADMTVAADGRLWIADPQNHYLVVVDPRARTATTVGREGDGPGELRDPAALAATTSSVLVLERQAGRLSEYTVGGDFVASSSVRAGMLTPVALSADSTAAAPSLGFNESLVLIADLRSGASGEIGTALAERPTAMSMSHLRDQALRREFPVEFRNNVHIAKRGDELWFASQFTGEIIGTDAAGGTNWIVQLPSQLVTEAHTSYFDIVRDEPGRIHLPTLVTDLVVVADELFVAVRTAVGSELRIVDASDGHELGHVRLDGIQIGALAIDPSRRIAYVAVPAAALLLSIPLGEGQTGTGAVR